MMCYLAKIAEGKKCERRSGRRNSAMLPALIFIVLSLICSASAAPPHKTCNTDAQCLNGGSCLLTEIEEGSFLQCHCKDGYSGMRCEHFCPLECLNGGICHSVNPTGADSATIGSGSASDYESKDFYCKCLGYFTGDLCGTPYENCRDGRQCFNGGECRDRQTHYIDTSFCKCPPDHTGTFCETSVAVEVAEATPEVKGRLSDFQSILMISGATFIVFVFGVVVAVIRRKRRYTTLDISHDEPCYSDDESQLSSWTSPNGSMRVNVV